MFKHDYYFWIFMHFAAKIHDTDGATVSFQNEIDQTEKGYVYHPGIDPGLSAWQAWTLPLSYLDLKNIIKW